ncbi:hypothetical protein V6N11_013688 [Hibiscus sabdariffa]|uniref:Uncharacterized protein n=1 Tax=Hibiscus sabdariffa TaxID=183260 RepID=A0ABR2A382_9ROSI
MIPKLSPSTTIHHLPSRLKNHHPSSTKPYSPETITLGIWPFLITKHSSSSPLDLKPSLTPVCGPTSPPPVVPTSSPPTSQSRGRRVPTRLPPTREAGGKSKLTSGKLEAEFQMFSSNQFDAASAFSGGGFMPSQSSQFANSTPSQSRDTQGLLPVTVVVQFRWFVLTNHNLLSVEILLTDGFGSSCYFPPKV